VIFRLADVLEVTPSSLVAKALDEAKKL
jgi:hypothetical protein